MSVSVLVPFKPDGGERDRIWAWMRKRWEQTLPDYELIVCSDGSAPDEPFNEGKAWNNCAKWANGDILILAESEVAFVPRDLHWAVQDVERTGGWRVAEAYSMLTEKATDRLLRSDPLTPLSLMLDPGDIDHVFMGTSVASNIIVPREAFDLVGGYDERYEGWGWIDKAMAAALDTLYAPHRRGNFRNFHLAHARGTSRDCNPALSRRYLDARGKPKIMRAIIDGRVAA